MYKIKKRVNIERSTNDILEKHPVPVLGIDYKVKIIYRNIKVPEVYVEKTVIKTKKSVTLEPMQAYERKIIHTKLQNSEKVETRSIGEEPRRRVVISLKRK